MNQLSYLVLAAALLLLSGNNGLYGIRALRQRPKSKPNFILDQYLGPWYMMFRQAPCSWSRSEEFEDYQALIKRSALGLDMDLYLRLLVGELAVIATDYKTFAIAWGCMKKTIDGMCEDPFLSVKTRSTRPGKHVIQSIESFLKKKWGIRLSDLQHVKHVSACVPPSTFSPVKFG